MRFSILSVAAACGLFAAASSAQAQYSRRTPIVEAVEKVRDGVVSLKVVKNGEWGRRNIQGTGIIVDERGFAITNHHVVHEAEKIEATLADGTKTTARVQHSDVTHDLVTPREVAALTHGIKVGDIVSFSHQGMNYTGRVNRITKRATILVESPTGALFSNGGRYETFYVPLAMLQKSVVNP